MKTINFTPKSKTLLLGLSLVISFISLPILSNSQSVAIKDSKFEKALVDLKIDKDGLNGSLRIADVDTVSRLIIANKGITDLTGIEAFKNLKLLNCDSNLLSFIKFINLPNLVEVHCASNKFVGLDFSYNKMLKILDCKNNLLNNLNISNDSTSRFSSFNAKGNPDLFRICVDDKMYASTNFLNVDAGVGFNDMDCRTVEIPDLSLETRLISQKIDKNGITGTIFLAETKLVTSLNLKNSGITDLKGIEYFDSLKALDCSGNFIKNINIVGLSNLRNLDCSNNRLTSIDITSNSKLDSINCSYNDLTTMSIGFLNNSLLLLECSYNKLNTLDLFGGSSLHTLICDNNQLTNLPISNLSRLQFLNCAYNKLTKLNIPSGSFLLVLICNNNNLTSLSVSNASYLQELYCYYNNLTALNINSNLDLTSLFCDFNNITNLDISNNKKIKELNCKNNSLTKLNIKNGNNKNMTTCVTYFNDNLKEICTDDARFASQNFLQKPNGAVYLDGNCINTSFVRGTSDFVGKIYPNPFKGSFILESNKKVESLSITNLVGQAISYSTVYSMGKVEIFVDAHGVFFLNFKSANKIYQSKIVSF